MQSEIIQKIWLSSVHQLELVCMAVLKFASVESSKASAASADHIAVVVVPCFPFDQAFRELQIAETAHCRFVSSCNSFPEISAGVCLTLSYGAEH